MQAPTADAGPWAGDAWRWFATPDRRLLVLSVILQLALAVFLGHSRDTRMFMASGYLVGSGHSPYVAQDLTAVFHHVGFRSLSVVGYPPPWPLVLGLLYRGTYALGHDLIVYNLAIKLPVIAANVGLAYLVAAVLDNLGAGRRVTRKAWTFLLLNPFLLYVGAAWGQIDAVVAVLAVAALALVHARRPAASAGVLALAVCFKPIAAPILLVVLVYLAGRSARRAALYAAVFAAGVFAFYVAPFFVFGWDASPLRQLNAHFVMSGTLSFMTVVRLVRDPLLMQGHWWLLGLAWLPALAVAALALRRGIGGFDDLVKKSAALVLVFYLTRTWLAEPNVVLLLPLVLILTSLGELDRRALTALWLIPLVFTLFNASPLQLLFVTWPGAMAESLAFVARYGDATLIVRAVLVIAWQAVGWWIVVTCFRKPRTVKTQPVDEAHAAAEGVAGWS
jgi:hypothetical protein